MTAADHPVSPEDLMAYLDGELPIAQAAVVQAHVAGCDRCQRSSGELRGVSRDMARWQVEDAPATFTAPWPPRGDQGGLRSRFGSLLKPSIAFGAVVSVVTVLVALTYRNMSNEPPQIFAVGRPPTVTTAPMPESKGVPYGGRLDKAGSGITSEKPPERLAIPAESPAAGVAAGQISVQRAGGVQATAGPSIARTARLRISSRDFEGTRRAVERIAGDLGGWFSRMDVSSVGQGRSLTAALQVPAARLDAALAALKPLGIVLEESQKGEDVTEQIVDVDARLSNARNTEKRLVDLLQKRTGELEHVLAAEREISRVREEIERFDAHRKSLDRRVTYATLTLEVVEEAPAALNLGPRPVPGRFRDAFVTGLTEAMDTALGLALFVLRVAPTLLLWTAVLVWPARAVVRWSRRRLSPEP
jgi:hypothetical protein